MLGNLFHACMHRMLLPLETTGITGLSLATGTGTVYRGHPIFAAFIGDYPEQILATTGITGDCPNCDIPHASMGEANISSSSRDIDAVLDIHEKLDNSEKTGADLAEFVNSCKELRIKPIVHPFWKNLPYVDIFQSITPDILHQGYQGLIKHLIGWLKQAYGEAEIDARCRRLPPNHHLRLFTKGISMLTRISGAEHNQICKFLLGIIIDLPLSGGLSPVRLLHTVRGALDFIYIAQLPSHTSETLDLLQEALQMFNDNKDILIELGIRDNFKIMKLHFFDHYRKLIELFGTADGYNTEYTERLHIDLIKEAYAATNHKDEYWQMVLWLIRKEQILRHSNYMEWRLQNPAAILESKKILPNSDHWILKMTKHPSVKSVSLADLMHNYGATYFSAALARFIALLIEPDLHSNQVEARARNIRLPSLRLPVYHHIKFMDATNLNIVDSIHAQPTKKTRHNREMHSRFDTAFISSGEEDINDIQGMI